VIVLDTNIVSAVMTTRGDQGPSPVEDWLQTVTDEVCTTAVTRSEILAGIVVLPAGRRKNTLAAAADVLFTAMRDRTLPYLPQHAPHYAHVVAARTDQPVGAMTAPIAATALAHGATVDTRNIRDFLGVGLVLVDPYDPTTW